MKFNFLQDGWDGN